MEFEGEQVFLSNPQDRIKNLLRAANRKDDEIRGLRSALQETEELLTAARERISRLLGEHAMAPKLAKKEKAARKKVANKKRWKKPGDPKRTFSPEKLAALRDNMAKARAARSAKTASAET